MAKKTNKTSHVLRLLTNAEDINNENPFISNSFKESVIFQSSETTDTKSSKEDSSDNDIKQINIIESIVKENIDEVLGRFSCADNSKLKSKIMIKSLNEIQPQYVFVSKDDEEELNKERELNKGKVISILVKNVLQLKNR